MQSAAACVTKGQDLLGLKSQGSHAGTATWQIYHPQTKIKTLTSSIAKAINRRGGNQGIMLIFTVTDTIAKEKFMRVPWFTIRSSPRTILKHRSAMTIGKSLVSVRELW